MPCEPPAADWYAVKVIARVMVWAESGSDAGRIAREAPHIESVLTINKVSLDGDGDERHQILNLRPAKPARDVAV